MNEFLGLRTAIYHVDDLSRAKDWYTRILGVQPYFDEPFYVGFNVGGFELGLQPREPGSPNGDPVPHRETVLPYWGVKSANATVTRLLALGAKTHQNAQDVGEGIVVASVIDPFGNLFGVIENPHFSLPVANGAEE